MVVLVGWVFLAGAEAGEIGGGGTADPPASDPALGVLGQLSPGALAALSGQLETKTCPAAGVMALPANADVAARSVVTLLLPDGSGSGFFVAPDGRIVTSAHVVGPSGTATVLMPGGVKMPAKVLFTSVEHDLALLDIEGDGYPCLDWADAEPTIGADVFVIGAPMGQDLSGSLSRGVLSGYRDFEGTRLVQTDASVNPGNSGGPALDATGHVLGVVRSKIVEEGFEGIGFAVAASQAKRFVDGTNEGGLGLVGGVVGGIVGAEVGSVHLRLQGNKEKVAFAIKTGETTTMVNGFALTQEQVRDLCAAPCEVDLQPGSLELLAASGWSRVRTVADAAGGDQLDVDAHFRGWPSSVAAAVGITSGIGLFTGGVFWAVGAPADDVGMESAGRATTWLSVLGLGTSIVVSVADKPRLKVAPSSTAMVFGAVEDAPDAPHKDHVYQNP